MNNDRPEENWAVYFTDVSSKPASILVDLGFRRVAPVASHPQLFVVRIDMRNPREDGFYNRDEGDMLYAIGDAIVAAIVTPQTLAFQVGTLTSDGKVSYYFYYPEQVVLKWFGLFPKTPGAQTTPATLEQTVDRVMAKFDGYKYQCFGSNEPGWEAYINVLYPSEWELQQIGNDQLLRHMRSMKDNTAAPRPIDHFIICPSAEVQMKIKSSAEALGFVGTANPIDADGKFSIELVRTDTPDEIEPVVWELFKLAKENKADYDGWGSVAVKE